MKRNPISLENHESPIVGGFGGCVYRHGDEIELGQVDRAVKVLLQVVDDLDDFVGHVLEGWHVLLTAPDAYLERMAVYRVHRLARNYALEVRHDEAQLVGRYHGCHLEDVLHHVVPVGTVGQELA